MTDDVAFNHRGSQVPGRPNYQNHLLIPIIDRISPNGAEGWRLVALAYKEESKETILRTEKELRDNWVKKLCNNFKKPTGMTGEMGDRVLRCIAIERRIMGMTDSVFLGVESDDEFDHEDGPPTGLGGEERAGLSDNEDGDDLYSTQGEDIDVPYEIGGEAGSSLEVEEAGGTPTTAVSGGRSTQGASSFSCVSSSRPGSRSLSSRPESRASSLASRKSTQTYHNINNIKTKNSTNKERGSVSKSIDRLCTHLGEHSNEDSAGGRNNLTVLMMQQQQFQQQQQQQQFQQQQQQQFQLIMDTVNKRSDASDLLQQQHQQQFLQQQQQQQFQQQQFQQQQLQQFQQLIDAMNKRSGATDKLLKKVVKNSKKRRHNNGKKGEEGSNSSSSSSSDSN